MRVIAALLWLISIALTGISAYAYHLKSQNLYLLIFTAAACLICMSMFSLLTAPIRYKIGERYFRHHPATVVLISILGVIVPFAAGMLTLTYQWTTSKVDAELLAFWCVICTFCDIYAAITATKAMHSM